MTGRTFQFDASLGAALRYVPELAGDDLRRATAAADNPLRYLEEFISRYVVTAVSDDGSIVFDSAGTYTFQGPVIIEGDLTITSDLQSQNFSGVPTYAGWQLRQDGTWEFNGAGTVRGAVDVVGDFTLTGGDILATGGNVIASADDVQIKLGPEAVFTLYRGLELSTTSDGAVGGVVADNGLDAILFVGVDGRGIIHNNAGRSTHSAGGDLYLESYTNGGAVVVGGSGTTDLEMLNGQVIGEGSSAASSPDFTRFGSTNTGIFWPTNAIGFSVAGTERMRINSSGDLGLSGDQIYFGGVANTSDYIQHNDGGNYFRAVLDGQEEWRINNAGDMYQAGDYHGFNGVSTADSIQHTGTDINFRTNAEVAFRIQRETTDRFTCNVDQSISNTADAQYLGYRFSDDTDTGLYRHANNILGLAAGGVPSGAFTPTGVAFSASMSTGTGDNVETSLVSVGGVNMYALRRDTSQRHLKSDIAAWGLTREQYMALQPSSFVWDNHFVRKDGTVGDIMDANTEEDAAIPEGAQLWRRAGFIYEEMAEIDLHLVGHKSIDWKAVAAATVDQTQDQWIEIDDLKAEVAELKAEVARLTR